MGRFPFPSVRWRNPPRVGRARGATAVYLSHGSLFRGCGVQQWDQRQRTVGGQANTPFSQVSLRPRCTLWASCPRSRSDPRSIQRPAAELEVALELLSNCATVGFGLELLATG